VTVAAALYLAAALAAHRMDKELLGPEHHPDRPDLRAALGQAGHALIAGIRHLVRDSRPALHALAAVTAARFCYGVLIVTVLMLSRYTFNAPSDTRGGLATLGTALAFSAVGYFLAAVISPWCSRRLGLPGWMTVCLASAAVFVPALGLSFAVAPVMLAALLLGLVTQGAKISADTIVQSSVADDYRGRVFAVYDVLFNVAFVAAAGITALVLPLSGRSAPVVVAVSLAYAASAALYARYSRADTRQR
jgi:MFS family permease